MLVGTVDDFVDDRFVDDFVDELLELFVPDDF